jgi:peroxiredoxin
MTATASQMLALGTEAPAFRLPDPDGNLYSLDDSRESDAYLIMFVCNHCPYVRHVAAELTRIGRDYGPRNVAIYAINSNDYERYPGDAPPEMKREAANWGFSFPYLVDEDQSTAKAYRAACTPDIYLFDSDRKLVYRGQLDDSRPSNRIPPSGRDLRAALESLLNGTDISQDQTPSIGCNIKWKPGNEPQ